MPELNNLNLGNKFECFSCGTRFYDLGKPEAICPKCGANQKDSDRGDSAGTTQAARKKRKVEPPKPIEIEEEEPIEDIPAGDEELDVAAVELDDEVEEEEDFDEED